MTVYYFTIGNDRENIGIYPLETGLRPSILGAIEELRASFAGEAV